MFSVDAPVEENAERFVSELDEYSIIMTTPLFSDEAARRVADEWERPGGRLDQLRKR